MLGKILDSPLNSGRTNGGRFAKGHKLATGRPRGAQNKATKMTVASMRAHGELLPHEMLRQIGISSKSPSIKVQALAAAAPYYAPKISNISATPLPSTTIDLPELTDVASVLAAQRQVAQAMAAGRMDSTAGQALINSLALMVKTAEMANASAPQTIVFEGSMIPDLPIEADDPANQHRQHVEQGPQPGAEAQTFPQVFEKKRA
jgi:hypothetical protein